jgi:Flp pilus assembly protein TadB
MTPVRIMAFTWPVLEFEPFQRKRRSLAVDSITTGDYSWHVQLGVQCSSWWFRGVIQGIKFIIIIIIVIIIIIIIITIIIITIIIIIIINYCNWVFTRLQWSLH